MSLIYWNIRMLDWQEIAAARRRHDGRTVGISSRGPSSEFIKSLNFGSNLKKKNEKKTHYNFSVFT